MAQLYFKYGAMGSSKTANALMTRFNYEERGQRTLLVKPQLDTRDGDHMVHSRIGLEHPCIYFHELRAMDEAELKQLKNRLNRMVGQLNGIGRMLDENRYCGDILIQIAAIEKALQAFGYIVLQEHMETCMAEDIQAGNAQTIEEVIELIKKLK